MNSKFLKASDAYGSTGGNTQHSHADVTGLTSTGETESTNNKAGLGPGSGAAKAHSHTGISLSSFSNADNAPLYSNVILAYYAKTNLKIAQHRIYQDNSMVLGAGTLRCNLTSAYGENVGDGECDNVSNGNLAVNTLHRAEFWLCNDVNLGEAATFDYFNHNLTTNKEYQIGEFYDACYHGDGAIPVPFSSCSYDADTGVVSVNALGLSISAGGSRSATSCEWVMYNFTTGSPPDQVKAQSQANVTGVSSGTNPFTGTLNATIGNQVVIDVTINGTNIVFGTQPPNTANESSTFGGSPLVVTIHGSTNVNVDLSVNGSDLISGGNTLAVNNVTYCNESTGWKTELNETFSSGSDEAHAPYSNWVNIPDLPMDVTRDAYWFINIPEGQPKADYAGTIYIRVSEAGT